MLKTLIAVSLVSISLNAFAQNDEPLPLDLAQQRARYAREHMNAAEEKAKAAEKKDKAAQKKVDEAQKRLDEAKAQQEQTGKQFQDAQAEAAKAKELHTKAYDDLRRSHEAFEKLKTQ